MFSVKHKSRLYKASRSALSRQTEDRIEFWIEIELSEFLCNGVLLPCYHSVLDMCLTQARHKTRWTWLFFFLCEKAWMRLGHVLDTSGRQCNSNLFDKKIGKPIVVCYCHLWHAIHPPYFVDVLLLSIQLLSACFPCFSLCLSLDHHYILLICCCPIHARPLHWRVVTAY